MFKKVFVTATLSVMFVAFVAYNGWNLFKLNSSLKKVVISKLQTAIGEECSVERLRLGFGSINLSGVKLAFENSPYQVWIDELQLGFSLKSLLQGKGSFEKTAEEVTLYKPSLTITYDPKPGKQPEVDLSLELSSETEKIYRTIIKEYDFIKKITVSEGEITILNSKSGESTKVAKKINGWVYADQDDQVWLRMAGHIFESEEYNMVLYGQFDIERSGLDFINVDLHDYKIGNEVPFLIPPYVDVQGGIVNGHLVITERLEPTRGFNIEGDISFEDGNVKFASEHLYIEDISIAAEIKDWNLYIKEASLKVNGSRTQLYGKIDNLLEPELDLTLVSEEFDIERFLTEFLPDEPLHFTGTTHCSLSISNTFATPRVSGILKSNSLRFHEIGLRDLQVAINFSDLVLGFDDIIGHINGSVITGQGNIDFGKADKWLDFKLNMEGDYTGHLRGLGLAASDNCYIQSEVEVFGPARRPVSRGEFLVKFSEDSTATLALNGSFSYSDGGVTLTAASDDEKFHLAASARDLFNEPRIDIEATNIGKLLAFTNDSKLNFVRNHYNLNFHADGSRDDFRFALDGHRRDNYERIFRIETDTTTTSTLDRIIGNIVLFPNSLQSIQGAFDLRILKDRISLSKLYLGDWLEGRVDFARNNLAPYDGRLEIQGLKLSSILSLLGKRSTHFDGDLYGQIDIDDDNGSPKIKGDFWLMNGFFRGIGPLNGKLNFVGDPSKLRVNTLSVENSGQTNLIASGEYIFSTGKIDGTLTGTGLDLNHLVTIISGRENIVGGIADLQVELHGSSSKIPLSGKIYIDKPQILMFHFDEASLDFGTREEGNGSYVSTNELMIGHATLARPDEFTIEGPVRLPITGASSLGVEMSGNGNFFALLPNLADVFQDSESKGHLDLRLSGGYTTPNFTGTKLHIVDGKIKFGSVVDKVSNIETELEILEDDYFLDIKRFVGTVQKQPFSITNARTLSDVNGEIFEPLKIAGNDLNLGALILTTPRKGVPLHIPALMEPGETGWYKVRGRTSKEPFYIAGPWERPHVRGEVSIHNANVVFPFYEGEGEANPVVRRILDNIDWDLKTVAEKDTRYVTQYSAAAYVNMEIDPENSVLNFSGVMRDSTFRIKGKVESTRGEFEYIDLTFRVQKFGAEFNQNSLYPLVYGKAWTVVRDSSNVPSDVYLTLYTVDDLNQEISKGPWDRITIKLSSEYGGYEETQGQVMASLGYTSENVQDQARKAVGYTTDRFLFRPIMRPLERQLERTLGLDVVRFSYAITRNFLDANFNNEQLRTSLALLRSSRLILGKYVTDDIYLLYTGELKAGIDYQFQNKGVGLQHVLGLEYRLNSHWLFQMEYDYNSLLNTQKDDKKVWLRHSFPF